jgi:hypothetical protein
MWQTMVLQEYIEELGSAILMITNSKLTLTGFTCVERLNDYYLKNIQCCFSNGIFDLEPLDFSKLKDNALFIINDTDNNKEYKYQFELLKKDSIKYKYDGKYLSRTYKIRKCNYTNKYNYRDMDSSILFDTKEDLIKYFKDRFNTDLILNIL